MIQYLTYKINFYVNNKIIRGPSQTFPNSVVPYWIGNSHCTVYLRQLRLSPRHFQVPVLKFSNICWIHKNMASLRHHFRCFKHNSSLSTPHLVNHCRIIEFPSVPACNSMFWKAFEEAMKSIGIVSWSSREVFIRYKFFLNFYLSFSLSFVFFLRYL